MATTSTASDVSDLTSLISTNLSSAVYPSDDSILSILQARFRSDLNYTRLGSTTLIAINPLRTQANLNDTSAESYIEQCYSNVNWEAKRESHPETALPPHPYELGLRVYHRMRRTGASQAIVYSGATNSGKSFISKLVTSQILRVACRSSKRESKLADQIYALHNLVNAFGCSKTKQNGNASRVNRYLELHFTSQGRLGAAKLLTFGLDKSRLSISLKSDERTFHIFYQLLAGATSEERETLNLQDVTSYALLASSGCYRLSGGPSSDDAIAMDELRAAMKTLGFKQKQLTAIFTLLSAILLLGNIKFTAPGTGESSNEAAKITDPLVLEEVAERLGVSSEELERALTTKSRMVRKEVVSSFLNNSAAAQHRDVLARNLYATLFAYVVESANHKVASTHEEGHLDTQIVQVDTSGFQNQTGSSISSPPSEFSSLDGHNDFAANFIAETVHNWLLRQAFDEEAPMTKSILQDGVKLPEVIMTDNSACVELLRGDTRVCEGSSNDRKPSGVLGSIDRIVHRVRNAKMAEDDEEALLDELTTHSSHGSYSVLPSTTTRHAFGINHYQGSCSYDANSFIAQEQDLFDSHFVQLLRSSDQPFLAKLFAGPSLATETHPLDDNVIVNAQVSIRPLRQPSPLSVSAPSIDPLLDPLKPYGVTRQLNSTLSEIMSVLCQADTIWSVFTIRPNDIDQPNSFDAGRVKSQIRSMILHDLIARKKCEYVAGMTFDEFCDRYSSQGVEQAGIVAGVTKSKEKVQAFVIANAWRDSLDYALGEEKVWINYGSWRLLEDRKRAREPREELITAMPSMQRDLSDEGDAQYPPTPRDTGNTGREGEFHESDELLLGRRTSSASNPFAVHTISNNVLGNAAAGWTDEWETKAGAYGSNVNPALNVAGVLEKNGNILEGRAIDAIEEESTTKTRRVWLKLTWALTWWIPSFCLSRCGKMKRPDVQLAWREKVTICLLIFFACGSILFYIIALGKLICPDSNRAWNTEQLSQHTASNDFFVAVRGKVYDISKFWKLQHSDSSVQVTPDVMQQLAGLDLTAYFPVPLTIGCPGLVTNIQLTLSTNTSSTDYTPTLTQAVHVSGSLATDQASKLSDINWYPDRFLPFMQQYYKGYFVTSKKNVAALGNDKKWAIVDKKIYDLSNYLWSTSLFNTDTSYQFLPSSVANLFAAEAGADISSAFKTVMAGLNSTYRAETQNCLDNVFYAGLVDFRETPRCQAQNYILLSFSILIMVTILAKFLAALQLTPKRNPEQQDKFVICQVPCYTEGEDELRKTIDSLAGLQYDDKRKLLFLICDGMIVGSGNELPTPRIVLDILGVDPKINPEPLMFNRCRKVPSNSTTARFTLVFTSLKVMSCLI